MSFKLVIETDNDAFQDDNAGSEIARILTDVAAKFGADMFHQAGVVYDINGNTVGHYIYSEETQ